VIRNLFNIRPLVLLSAVAVALLMGCAGGPAVKETPAETKAVGLFDPDTNKTTYTFTSREKAQKLVDKITGLGQQALIREHEIKGKTVYRVYVVKKRPDPEELVWPKPPHRQRIAYIGLLGAEEENQNRLSRLLFGKETESPERLVLPKGIAEDSAGNLYVCTHKGLEIYDRDRKTVKTFIPKSLPDLVNPVSIAIDPEDRLYVSDVSLKMVLVYKNRQLVRTLGEGEFEKPYGLAIDPERRRLYVSDIEKNAVYAFSLNGEPLFVIESPVTGDPEQRFGAPTDIAVNSRGEILVVVQGGSKVVVFGPDREFVRALGGFSSTPGYFVRPKSIAIDSNDNIYVVDAAFDNFQVFDPEGKLLIIVGSGGSSEGRFNLPSYIFIDSRDRIYVSELGTNRVQIFQYVAYGDSEAAEMVTEHGGATE